MGPSHTAGVVVRVIIDTVRTMYRLEFEYGLSNNAEGRGRCQLTVFTDRVRMDEDAIIGTMTMDMGEMRQDEEEGRE